MIEGKNEEKCASDTHCGFTGAWGERGGDNEIEIKVNTILGCHTIDTSVCC